MKRNEKLSVCNMVIVIRVLFQPGFAILFLYYDHTLFKDVSLKELPLFFFKKSSFALLI